MVPTISKEGFNWRSNNVGISIDDVFSHKHANATDSRASQRMIVDACSC